MSALMADHRDYADDVRQPSLFDVLAPPSARPQSEETVAPEGGQVVEFPRRHEAAEGEVVVEGEASVAEAPSGFVEPSAPLAPEDAWLVEIAPELDEAEMVVLAPETEVAGEPRTPRAAGASLAGPTLDDVMSRVWEGLAIGLPAACPVCHGEVLPAVEDSRIGACTSCGTTVA
ncbi:hypothetical protein OJ997_04390 [Solirubrobacter phytolaccae]|uniref:Uncharacterized protein n=1 Tax=Solirubrobacter phytolaccae TaxID=1404360 RepID=A0A9X3S612_9ACTN|nr:hypothetical protein [Solirubrobacter phytolaccae]MDA0179524.1 hypothetical protein [Solirubrobacter phytolaccae]